ncbi:DUF3450 domain-containing protein [Marinobacter sp. chi1]|uniref:DUF3450 domain-containing protein n=1 Tax=Marinobacter suaedae TaxID=3057675 RepID=A0ABT8W1P9_9GAMM|nr:DUF3450 domain-containing protein [Marinobacter sp. chi1]MDO3722154.1 DUF3450 domain-containing protein [Marinobacter sp. chi1]
MRTRSKPMKRCLSLLLWCGWSAVSLPCSALAADLEQVTGTNNAANEAAKASQQRIDSVAEQTDKLLSEYRMVIKEIDGLRVYNGQLKKQIASQMSELESLRDSIDRVTVIERQVIPLMLRMVDGLRQFVELDVPFLEQERQERLENLESLMDRADVSVAEKFRKVLEAYQIENEYGRTIEAYSGTLDLDGTPREVDFLRIGRVSLIYQTENAQHSGLWDQTERQWVSLPDQYRSPIKEGLRIARKEVAPNLLKLPVPGPEAAE